MKSVHYIGDTSQLEAFNRSFDEVAKAYIKIRARRLMDKHRRSALIKPSNKTKRCRPFRHKFGESVLTSLKDSDWVCGGPWEFTCIRCGKVLRESFPYDPDYLAMIQR